MKQWKLLTITKILLQLMLVCFLTSGSFSVKMNLSTQNMPNYSANYNLNNGKIITKL